MTADSRYIHGVSRAEQARLSTLNRLLNPGSLRELGVERATGSSRSAPASASSRGKWGGLNVPVVAIERNAEQLAEAKRAADESGDEGLVAFREGDALRLPLTKSERGSFDVAHCRFLLEHVSDPAAAVAEMVRALRPGGRIVLEDDDHDVMRLWPEPAGFPSLWNAYVRSYDRIGNDPYVGRRLVSLLRSAGAKPARNQWLFFGSCSGQSDFQTYAENLAGVLESARTAILGAGLIEPSFFERTLADLRDWSCRPDAALWYSVCWAEGVREV